MDLEPDELGSRELGLRWIVVIRIFWMLFIPLFSSLFFDSFIVKGVFWALTLFMFWTAVGSWGHSVIALMVGLLPFYIYSEWNDAPRWVAWLGGFLAVFEFGFIRARIRDIQVLRTQIFPPDEVR